MTTWPRDQRTRPRTASSNPGPIHAPSTTDHKNCRVWRWFWWHRRPAHLSTPPTDLWIINPNQLRLLLVPGELVTRGRLQVSGQSHNSSVYGPTWLPQASTTITPPLPPSCILPWNARHNQDEAMYWKVCWTNSKTTWEPHWLDFGYKHPDSSHTFKYLLSDPLVTDLSLVS